MKNTKLLTLILLVGIFLAGCKYEDGPIISLRTKQNRVAHRIGKYWKSEGYSLKMGQEGYALQKLGVEGFLDIGDWSFSGDKSTIKFDSEEFANFEMTIKRLQHKKMTLTGAFPFDDAPIEHEFELDKTIEDLSKQEKDE